MILITEMSDDLKGAIITALVTGIISIIGFIITNNSMRKNFKNELIKQRDSIALEKMATMPFKVLDLMDKIIKSNNKEEELENFKNTMNEIYSYGSEKAISIVALMQKENYAAREDLHKLNDLRVMSFYVLLATQIKYDVTGAYVNPEFWFNMRLNDFEELRTGIKEANNQLVKELNLNKKMNMA